MKRKSAAREREEREGHSLGQDNGVIPGPHLHQSAKGFDTVLPYVTDDQDVFSDVETEHPNFVQKPRRTVEFPGEHQFESTKPVPFLISCLVACVFCTIFWLTLILSIWYFSH